MAVAFDNASTAARNFGATSITTPSFTIAGSNRAGIVGISTQTASTSGFSADIGGTSGSAISGAESSVNSHVIVFGVTAPPTGSQTATASWTTASDAVVGAITVTGVDQVTPFANGTSINLGYVLSGGLSITSTSGDLTASVLTLQFGGGSEPTTDQTRKYTNFTGACDIGPGTGTATHTWTFPGSDNAEIAGINFKASGGGGGGSFPARWATAA